MLLTVSCQSVTPSYVGTYVFGSTSNGGVTRANTITGEVEVLTFGGWVNIEKLQPNLLMKGNK
jgi:hypothetical protein